MHFTKTNRFQLSHNVANPTAQFVLWFLFIKLIELFGTCVSWCTVLCLIYCNWTTRLIALSVLCWDFHSSSVVVASLYIHTGGIMHVGKPRTRPNVNLYFLNNEWKFVLGSCHTLKSLSHLKIVGSEGLVLCAFLWCQSAFSWRHFPVVSQWWHLQLRRLAQNAL